MSTLTEIRFSCPAGESAVARATLCIENARIRDIDLPNLYTITAELTDGAAVLDTDSTLFGVRAVTVDAKNGFCLNGRPLKLKGGLSDGYRTSALLAERVRRLDATRPVGGALCSFFNGLDDEDNGKFWQSLMQTAMKNGGSLSNLDGEYGRAVWNGYTEAFCAPWDVVGYNYLNYHYDEAGELFPNRVIPCTESKPREVEEYWADVERLPYLISDFEWTSHDYLGEAGIGKALYVEPEQAAADAKQSEGSVQMGLNMEALMARQRQAAQEEMEVFGTGAPGKVHTFQTQRTEAGDILVMRAHEAARDAMKAVCPHLKVGLTLSLHDIQPQPGGEAQAEREWAEEFTHYLPYIQNDDFLGVQNYTRTLMGPDGSLPAPDGAETTQMGYEVYPEALEHVIRKAAEDFQGRFDRD